jgi:hypothetical protein
MVNVCRNLFDGDDRLCGLSQDELLRMHNETAEHDQPHNQPQDEETDMHFVALVPLNGAVYELDGRNPAGHRNMGQRGLMEAIKCY